MTEIIKKANRSLIKASVIVKVSKSAEKQNKTIIIRMWVKVEHNKNTAPAHRIKSNNENNIFSSGSKDQTYVATTKITPSSFTANSRLVARRNKGAKENVMLSTK